MLVWWDRVGNDVVEWERDRVMRDLEGWVKVMR